MSISQNETIDNILQKKEAKMKEIHEQKKKVFQLENELIEIDKTLATFSDKIILENMKLSEQQKMIVDATEDNILVVACPGSGKTHTLIARYIKLILDEKITNDSTLLITFTKKAGMEMLHRLSKFLPHKLPWHVGSLHGLGYKVLQEYMEINYSVLDEKDVRDYLKSLMYEESTRKQLKNLTDDEIHLINLKICMIIYQASIMYPFDMKCVLKRHNLDKYLKEFNLIYKMYQTKKKKENIVDFNDLMIMFCKFLDSDSSNDFKNKIQYVFFDEYQDVNPVQNYILKKLAIKSKVMVVGDDAQSIYAFRGSSVKYILNFNEEFNDTNKTKKMYLLEENYRSTPLIVNFCQDIISHNMNQFEKAVVSRQDKSGIKPSVYEFKTEEDQYKWVTDDIVKKLAEGVELKQMVVLARKNSLLKNIELHLLSNKIPVAKNLGSSLLDTPHIKDFLAFVIICTNPKSSIHWKRVISLYPGYGIKRANNIIDENPDIDILKSVKIHIDKNKDSVLTELYEMLILLKKLKSDMDKARLIAEKLQRLWMIKKESNIEDKIQDIFNLLNYLKGNTSLVEFINDLYLNQEIETNMDNVLYLTTIHGAKGLEWDYVYIIDMDSSNFPAIKPKYYIDELGETDEERRLFYVAASRAKKYLYITYNMTEDVMISPLMREIKIELYNGCGILLAPFKPTYIISKDVSNYLRFIGYSKISEMLLALPNMRSTLHKMIEIPTNIEKLAKRVVIGNFMDYLIAKIVQINFPKKIVKFDLKLVNKNANFPQSVYSKYIDSKCDWRDILDTIYYISTYKMLLTTIENESYKNFLTSDTAKSFYIDMEKGLCKMIGLLKPKEIRTHYNIGQDIKGEIDILCDETIIEVKSSIFGYSEVATVPNISQELLYAYLMKKKDIVVNKMILYNPLNGEVNNFDISNFDLAKYKKTIFNSTT